MLIGASQADSQPALHTCLSTSARQQQTYLRENRRMLCHPAEKGFATAGFSPQSLSSVKKTNPRTLCCSSSETHPTGRKSLKMCLKSATQSHPMEQNSPNYTRTAVGFSSVKNHLWLSMSQYLQSSIQCSGAVQKPRRTF